MDLDAGRRVVLMPQGPPQDPVDQRHCNELVHAAGGDLSRVFDSPRASFTAYGKHVARIRMIADGSHMPIVVLTRPETALAARHMVEDECPALMIAPWCIYWQARRDREFLTTLTSSGVLVGDLHEAPLWITDRNQPFMLLSPLVRDLVLVDIRMQEVVNQLTRASGVVRKVNAYLPEEFSEPVLPRKRKLS